jgi:hypothetical protein
MELDDMGVEQDWSDIPVDINLEYHMVSRFFQVSQQHKDSCDPRVHILLTLWWSICYRYEMESHFECMKATAEAYQPLLEFT